LLFFITTTQSSLDDEVRPALSAAGKNRVNLKSRRRKSPSIFFMGRGTHEKDEKPFWPTWLAGNWTACLVTHSGELLLPDPVFTGESGVLVVSPERQQTACLTDGRFYRPGEGKRRSE